MKNKVLVINSRKKDLPRNAVIFLHGLGSSGENFSEMLSQTSLIEDNPHTQFIFPNAPFIPVTLNNNLKMRAWYDIESLETASTNCDIKKMESSLILIKKIIKEQIELMNIPSSKFILVGFSQGGVMAILSSLLLGYEFYKTFLLSTYFPCGYFLKKNLKDIAVGQKRNFIISHGLEDNIIPCESGNFLKSELLKNFNIEATLYNYPIDHSLCIEQINMISDSISEL